MRKSGLPVVHGAPEAPFRKFVLEDYFILVGSRRNAESTDSYVFDGDSCDI